MDHDVSRGWLQKIGTVPTMNLGSQWPLAEWLLSMHEWHPVPTMGQNGIFRAALELLLGKHTHTMPYHMMVDRNGFYHYCTPPRWCFRGLISLLIVCIKQKSYKLLFINLLYNLFI